MNKEELATKLNASKYPFRLNKELADLAKANGLVIVYGASDDLMEFEGAIRDEVGVYDGGFAFINANDVIQPEDLEQFDDGNLETVLHHFPKTKVIEALWCKEGDYTWAYKTDIPHAIFDILDDDEMYCRGIVFSLDELEPTPSKPNSRLFSLVIDKAGVEVSIH